MARIRSFRLGEDAILADICLRTADSGGDATGVLADDDLWASIFLLPYLARHPDFAFVVEAEDGRITGYVVAAPDTDEFETWFKDQWWPLHAARWPRPTLSEAEIDRQAGVIAYAYGRGPGAEPYGTGYPAHLHIDVLPELQGQGWGRRLIDTVLNALRDRGVSGVHLVADRANAGAVAFYDRLGFVRLDSPDDVQAFGMPLSAS